MTIVERVEWLKSCTDKQRREYYGQVAELGCAACGKPYTPEGKNRTAVHHCFGHGFPAKREHRPVIGLCSFDCHQDGPYSIHRAKMAFCAHYGTQMELATKVNEMIEQR